MPIDGAADAGGPGDVVSVFIVWVMVNVMNNCSHTGAATN
jgi:hypothetical protein